MLALGFYLPVAGILFALTGGFYSLQKKPSFGQNIQKKMRFFGYFAQFSAKTLLDWVRPPPPLSAKKSKKISVFSVKEILDSTRPLPPPFGKCPKKTSFPYLIAPLRGAII